MQNKGKSRRRPVLCLLLFLLLLLTAALYLTCRRFLPVSLEPALFTESTEPLDNPWQGFYQMKGYKLSEQEPCADTLENDLNEVPGSGLFLLQINLSNYQNTPLSDAALTHLRELLNSWSRENRRLILRFVYDWDGRCRETEPESLDTILEHMSAVGPVVNEFTGSVYLVQGLFLGDYGEMHGSRHMSPQNMDLLAEKLSQVLSDEIFLSVRTPAQLRSILKTSVPLSAEEAFTGTLASRLGLFNDGMLGSVTDTGTYGEAPPKSPSDYTAKLDRQGELDFQNQLNRYVPNGGEVILDNPCNDLEAAVSDLSQMHVSYLNSEYDQAVLEKWKNSVYTGDGVFQGTNGYDYIRAHLGCRYVLRNCGLDFHPLRDNEAALSITLENTGFSACYQPLEVSVTVREKETGETLTLVLSQDLRYLDGGDTAELSVSLPVRELEKGVYQISLKVRETSGKGEIQLANPTGTDGYELGTLRIGGD